MTLDVTERDVMRILGALSSMLRYEQSGLDRAKEDDAVNRWADRATETRAIMRRIEEQLTA